MVALSVKGGVKVGLVEPYTATILVPTAAAICIKPESFVKTTFAKANKSIASVNEVFPTKFLQV